MNNPKLLCLCLAACVLVGSSSAARVQSEELWAKEEREAYASGELVKHPDFGFFYFVRQWPGTFCSSHACPLLHHRNKYRFTVHGLWPNYNGGGWPQFCDHSKPFDADALEDLMPQLEEVWPSYMDSKDSDSFWAHEWNKHGTCALSSLPNEHSYFKAILDLNTKYDLEVPLKAAGIVPSETKRYAATDFTAAIKGAYGTDFDIHCSADGELTEVWMCFDKALQPMDCPRSRAASSTASVEAGQGEVEQRRLGYPRCKYIIMPPVPGSPVRAAEQDSEGGEEGVAEGAAMVKRTAAQVSKTEEGQAVDADGDGEAAEEEEEGEAGEEEGAVDEGGEEAEGGEEGGEQEQERAGSQDGEGDDEDGEGGEDSDEDSDDEDDSEDEDDSDDEGHSNDEEEEDSDEEEDKEDKEEVAVKGKVQHGKAQQADVTAAGAQRHSATSQAQGQDAEEMAAEDKEVNNSNSSEEDGGKWDGSNSESSESSNSSEEEGQHHHQRHRMSGSHKHMGAVRVSAAMARAPHSYTCMLAKALAVIATALILVAAVLVGVHALRSARGGSSVRPITSSRSSALGSSSPLFAADEAASVALEEGLTLSQVQGLKQPLLRV